MIGRAVMSASERIFALAHRSTQVDHSLALAATRKKPRQSFRTVRRHLGADISGGSGSRQTRTVFPLGAGKAEDDGPLG
jgi:hypothetical protein